MKTATLSAITFGLAFNTAAWLFLTMRELDVINASGDPIVFILGRFIGAAPVFWLIPSLVAWWATRDVKKGEIVLGGSETSPDVEDLPTPHWVIAVWVLCLFAAPVTVITALSFRLSDSENLKANYEQSMNQVETKSEIGAIERNPRTVEEAVGILARLPDKEFREVVQETLKTWKVTEEELHGMIKQGKKLEHPAIPVICSRLRTSSVFESKDLDVAFARQCQ